MLKLERQIVTLSYNKAFLAKRFSDVLATLFNVEQLPNNSVIVVLRNQFCQTTIGAIINEYNN